MLHPVAAALSDAEVRGLDVAVVDPGAVEGDEGLKQVNAPPLKQVQRQPLPAAQHLRQRLVARGFQHQGAAATNLDRAFDEPYQPRVLQPREHLGLGGKPASRGVIHGDLQHAGGIGAGRTHGQVRDQQAHRGRAGAEAAFKPVPAVDDPAGSGLKRIDDILRRASERLFGLGQQLKEGPDIR